MKKMLSLLLGMALLIKAPAVMYAQNTDETAKMQEITVILTKLGIVDETAFETDKSLLVTRAELAYYAATLIKHTESKEKRYFHDVSADYWAFGCINAMVEFGAISLAEDGRFHPDDNITYEQACKILVSAAGYREYAAPSYSLDEYVRLANNVGIGISYDVKSELTFGAALEMLYNTLTVKMAKSDMNDDEDKRILDVYYSCYEAEGTVDSVYGLQTDKAVGREGCAYISGEMFLVDKDVKIEDYFGETVKFTYIEDNDTKEVIFVKPKYNRAVTEIQAGLIESFDKDTGRLRYYIDKDSSRTKTTNVPKKAVFVYNGALMTGSLEDKINEFINGSRKGSIRIVERTGSDSDMVIIKSYETYIAKSYDVRGEILYNAYDKDKNINLSMYDVVRIRSRYEDNVSLPVVFPAALSVACSEDNTILEIYLTDEQQKTVNNLTEDTVTLDGEKYDLDTYILDRFIHELTLNATVKIKVDIFGEIVYAEQVGASSDFEPGYITKMFYAEEYVDDVLTIRVFRKNKEFSYFDIKDKVKIDGTVYKVNDTESIISAFPGMNICDANMKITIEPQIIRFKVNAENIVKEIDTYNVGASENKDYSLTRTSNGEKLLRYWGADKRYGELDIVDSTTLIMSVPSVDANGYMTSGGEHVRPEDKMYAIGASVSTDYSYYVEAYYYTNRFIADVLLIKSVEDRYKNTLCMFDQISEIWDESEGDVKSMFIGFTDSGKITYTVTENIKPQVEALNRGDIIRIGTSESDTSTITSIIKVFDVNTMGFSGSSSTTDYLYVGTNLRSTYNLAKMYAYDTRGTILRGSYKIYDAADDITDIAVNSSVTKIVVYDKERRKEKIYQGTIDDIRTYKMYGETCDMVLYNTAGITSPVMFVVRR